MQVDRRARELPGEYRRPLERLDRLHNGAQPEEVGRLVARLQQTSYLSQISHIISVEKNLSCGEISDFCKVFEKFMEFYRNLCRFCLKFVWRKISVEKN